jgi:hypothetical protein
MRSSPDPDRPLIGAVGLGADGTAEFGLERSIAVREALAEVAALPDMQREVILLSAVDGRSHDEVAALLGVTHGAVRGLLYRARASLRAGAAAITPQPLINWASGSMGRSTPMAERLAEFSGPAGAAGMTGALLKGAVVTMTAAVLVAGAVAPLHRHDAHRSTATASSSAGLASVTADAEGQAPLTHRDGKGPARSSRSAALAVAEVGGATSQLRTTSGRPRGVSAPGAILPVAQVTPTPVRAVTPSGVAPAQKVNGGQAGAPVALPASVGSGPTTGAGGAAGGSTGQVPSGSGEGTKGSGSGLEPPTGGGSQPPTGGESGSGGSGGSGGESGSGGSGGSHGESGDDGPGDGQDSGESETGEAKDSEAELGGDHSGGDSGGDSALLKGEANPEGGAGKDS